MDLPPGTGSRPGGMKTPLCKKDALAGPEKEQLSNLLMDRAVCGISQNSGIFPSFSDRK